MEHVLHLQPAFYAYILHGTKRIELRLYDEKRQQIQLGDTIKFCCEPDLTQSLRVRVVGILRYPDFATLLQDFDCAVLADRAYSKERLLATLQTFYPLVKQQQYGVVGLRIEPL
ncbi:MAG: ASCH domain-containing protein [Prevotella sp.]|nr:ASCH domain-containing protein [Prevotella sp.]